MNIATKKNFMPLNDIFVFLKHCYWEILQLLVLGNLGLNIDVLFISLVIWQIISLLSSSYFFSYKRVTKLWAQYLAHGHLMDAWFFTLRATKPTFSVLVIFSVMIVNWQQMHPLTQGLAVLFVYFSGLYVKQDTSMWPRLLQSETSCQRGLRNMSRQRSETRSAVLLINI